MKTVLLKFFTIFSIVEICLLLSFGNLFAQWSNSPSSNLILCQKGYPVYAQTVQSGNHYFITYFKYVDRKLCLFMQILDFYGRPQLEEGGRLISDHPQNTWLATYDLIIDQEGNAIVAFSDVRNDGLADISLYKMDTTGTQLWGDNGINFFSAGTNDFGPSVAVNQDNSITVSWCRFSKPDFLDRNQVILYRISDNGTILWNQEPRIVQNDEYDLLPLDIMSVSDGSLLLAYTIQSAPSRQIAITKIDSNGRDAWSKDIIITKECISEGATIGTYAGNDGVFYLTWNANGCFGSKSAIYLQGITADGNLLWPEPGVSISEDRSVEHYFPLMQGVNADGDALILWYVYHQLAVGWWGNSLYGQLIGQDGELKWGSNGIEILHRLSNVFAYASLANDTALVVYTDPIFQNDIYQAIKVKAFNKEGSSCWTQEVIINDLMTSKSVCGLTPIFKGQGVIVFGEDDGVLDETRLEAQNIWTDGTMGLKEPNSIHHQNLQSGPKVYFNPEAGIIIGELKKRSTIVICNSLGQVVHQQLSDQGESPFIRIPTDNWNPGVYAVTIQQERERIIYSKIIIY